MCNEYYVPGILDVICLIECMAWNISQKSVSRVTQKVGIIIQKIRIPGFPPRTIPLRKTEHERAVL
jgi:hypothetical protein